MTRPWAAVAIAAAALLLVLSPTQARADGDPASDYLIEQALFLPPDANVSAADQRKLIAVVQQASRRGFPIRVAVIGDAADLGSVTALWKKPRLYARFLATEITYFYKGRLLVVMPNGFGFDYPKHDRASETALLAKIPIKVTPSGLAREATSAVQRLAAAQGVRVGGAAPRVLSIRDVLEIVGAALIALPLAGLLLVHVRRRDRKDYTS
jgi:hypothetical protein